MTRPSPRRDREVTMPDHPVDDGGNGVNAPERASPKAASEAGRNVGAMGPTNWWRLGLILLGAVALALLLLQVFTGGPATIDSVPGSPVSPPAAPPPPG